MTVKTGQSWAGTFVTLDSTGALSAATTGPAGTLYVDGTANGATVTITGSNPYKWSVTLPALTAGQRVDMYITATISTIATAGFVASEQADTALTSEVKTDTAAILADTGTDGVVLKAAGLADDAVTKLQANLALEATLTAIKGAGWQDNYTLSNIGLSTAETANRAENIEGDILDGGRLDLLIDAIKAKTDNLPADPAAVGSAMTLTAAYDKAKDDVLTPLAVVDNIVDGLKTTLDNIHDTDLPAVKTETAAIKAKTDTIPASPAQAGEYTAAIAAIPTTPLLAANYTEPDNATIGTIAGNVDDLETRLTAARAGYLDKLNVSGTLAHSNDAATYKADVSGLATSTEVGAIALLGETVVGSYTVQDILTILAAKMVGKATGGGTATITYRGVDDSSNVVVETVDTKGNRSAVTLTV